MLRGTSLTAQKSRMTSQTQAPPAGLNALAALGGLVACGWLGYLALSQQLPAPSKSGPLGAPPALAPCVMDRDGYLIGHIYGTAQLDIDWRGAALSCAGNARPNGAGLRLFFAGQAGSEDRLLLVLGIAADVSTLMGREHDVSVTLIDEASGQFFHSPADRCFTRVREVSELPAARAVWRVDGDLYCAGALPSVSDQSSVTLGDMAYSGRLTLERE